MKSNSHISLFKAPQNDSLLTTFPTSTRSDKSRKDQAASENLKVAIRVRPQLVHEYQNPISVFYDENRPDVIKVSNSSSANISQSHYDKIFRQDSTQAQVFHFLEDSVLNTLGGFNCTIFAYGQTGSGKTYTMFGPNWEESMRARMFGKQGKNSGADPMGSLFGDQASHGVIPRAIQRLFQELRNTGAKYTVYCSFLQVYNERLYDLLQDYETKRPLQIREDKGNGIYVEQLTEYVITNVRDCFTLLKRGECNRITRATRANIASSRSHTIFQLLIETDNVDHRGYFKHGKLNLCDLAGSEKLGKEEQNPSYVGGKLSEKHFSELKTINLSLTTLGKVISALSKKSNLPGNNGNVHIPYRDSKLTRFLQDSLGGHTRTVLIATISPNADCSDESLSTLKFADRAKSVMVKVKANEVNASDDALVAKLQREVQHLREVLNLRRKGDPHDMSQQILMLKQQNTRLKELASRVQEVELLKKENKMMRLELQRLQIETSESGGEGATQNSFFITSATGGNEDSARNQSDSSLGNQVVSPQAIISEMEELQYMPSQKNLIEGSEENKPIEEYNPRRMSNSTLPVPSAEDRTFSNLNKESMKLPKFKYASEPSKKKQRSSPMRDIENQIAIAPQVEEIEAPKPPKYQSTRAQPNNAARVMKTPEVLNFNRMSADQIAEALEFQRLKEFERAANNLKQNLTKSGRCPICTLPTPCKHYKSPNELPSVNKLKIEDIKISDTSINNNSFTKKRRSEENVFIHGEEHNSSGFQQPAQNYRLDGNQFLGVGSNRNGPIMALQHFSMREGSPRDMQLPPVMAHSKVYNKIAHHSQAKAISSNKAYSVTRGSATNESMYSVMNRSIGNGESTASEGRPYPRQMKGPKRGVSEDIVVRIRGKHGVYKTQKADVNQTLQEARETENRKIEIKKANQRLRILEKLERYREEKLRRQFEQLEEEKRKEEEERMRLVRKEEARRKYLEKQKRELEEHNRIKAQKEREKQEQEQKQVEKLKENDKKKKKYFADQKVKINEYKVKKQIIDDFLKANQIYTMDDLQERGQVYLPQGLVRKHQQGLYGRIGHQSVNRGSSQDTEQIPEGMGWVQYPIVEREGEQKDSLDMLQGMTTEGLNGNENEAERLNNQTPLAAERIPEAQVASLRDQN